MVLLQTYMLDDRSMNIILTSLNILFKIRNSTKITLLGPKNGKREFGGEKIKIKAPHILFTKVQYLLWLKKYQKQGIGEVKFKNLKK